MIKFLIAFSAPLGMTKNASLDHYRHRHAPLVASVTEFQTETRAYLQNYVVETATPGAAKSSIVGVSELWFNDWTRYHAAFSNEHYLKHIRPDEERFADLASVLVAFAQEDCLYGGEGTPKYKLFQFWESSEALPSAEFRRRWADYGAALSVDETVRAGSSTYVQNRATPPEENPFPLARIFDGIDEFWLRSPQDAEAVVERLVEHATQTGIDAGANNHAVQVITQTCVVPGFNRQAQPDRDRKLGSWN